MENSRNSSTSSLAQHTKPSDILGIKVMRLTKPTFHQFHPIYSEHGDILGETFIDYQENDIRSVPGLPGAQPGLALQLPRTFGKLFLGETFSAVIALHNESNQVAKKVNLKVELSTQNQRYVLLSPFPIQQIDSGGSIEKVVSHEVHELEVHSLVVSVSYTHSTGEDTVMKRSFRIPVVKPLDVKTTNYAIEEEGDILFEIQIENLMSSPFVLEVFKFEPVEGCTVVSCNESYPGDVDEITPSSWPSPKLARDGHSYCSIKVGKVDIAWVSSYGERGRIQTSPLEAKVERSKEFMAIVSEVPGQVNLEEPFVVTCLLKNLSKSSMLLKSVFPRQHTGGVLWSGLSGTELGELSPNAHKEVIFTAIPIKPGLQDISGLEFIELASNKSFLLKRTKVFVHSEHVVTSD